MIIRIKNTNKNIRKADLVKLFGRFGKVRCAIILRNKAFVEMPITEHALKATDEIDGLEFEGTKLMVDIPGRNRTKTVCQTPLGLWRLL